MDKLKEFLKESHKKLFLDVCTGQGDFMQFLKSIYNNFDKMIGIDIIHKTIKNADEKNEDNRIRFVEMSAEQMEYENNSFDIVCLSNSLHHLADIPKVLNEMKRVVKKGGYIIINEMLSNNLDAMQISHLKLHHFAAKIDRLLGDSHNETYTKDEIITRLKNGIDLSLYKSWVLEVPRRKENTKEELDWIHSVLDRLIERIPEYVEKEEYVKEAEEIKKYIKEHGYDGANSLLVILTK
ncbi:class I SAM-dependent methyltransferase [Mycoplasmatota bacterium]|nr:class I SAM-dependent methyltransferase [Mycoplasmatota bacterium]